MRIGSRVARWGARALVLGFAASATSCLHTLSPGELGALRFVTVVRGQAPLALFPPVSDRAGNAYTMYGALNLLADMDTHAGGTSVFVSVMTGGEKAGCAISRGIRGAHGFIGFAQDHYYYWSGDALVGASGEDGTCNQIIDIDPASGNQLAFKGVMPFVVDSPTRHRTVAIIQTPTDLRPFQAVIDLFGEIYTNSTPFGPSDATNLVVLGTGHDKENHLGVALVQYQRGDATVLDARFLDDDANTAAQVIVHDDTVYPEYAVQGFLQAGSNGVFAGLLVRPADGPDVPEVRKLLVVNRSGGRTLPVSSMAPVGVHVWDGKLWLVGTRDNRPAIAPIDATGVGSPIVWAASERAAAAMQRPLDVFDDRTLPSRSTRWATPTTALGEFPFVTPFPPDHYADGTTLWLVAGPSFGDVKQTAVGIVPVGITYP